MNPTVLKMLLSGMGLNSDEIMAHIGGIGQSVLEFKSQLDRIEANQAEILLHLRQAEQNVSRPALLAAAGGENISSKSEKE